MLAGQRHTATSMQGATCAINKKHENAPLRRLLGEQDLELGAAAVVQDGAVERLHRERRRRGPVKLDVGHCVWECECGFTARLVLHASTGGCALSRVRGRGAHSQNNEQAAGVAVCVCVLRTQRSVASRLASPPEDPPPPGSSWKRHFQGLEGGGTLSDRSLGEGQAV